MQERPKRIFVSYARADGEACARDLRGRLEQEGFSLWQDRTDMEGGRDWWNQIDDALRHVEYMLVVMTPRAAHSEVVTREWRLARQRGVGVIPVLGAAELDFSRLPRWMRDTHFADASIPEQWKRLVRQLESPNAAPRVPFMAPDLPADFVERPREFEGVVASLVNREGPVAITAALKGAGGYGKTTLAIRLCHDERVLEEFHDGVLWVTLGERPGDVTSKVIDLIETLSGERPGFADADTAAAKLAELLADHDLLLVIDDVWNAADTKPFLRGGPRCARLITTRNSDTLPDGCLRTDLDSMQSREAVRLLGWKLPDSPVLGRLASRLGEWPLLLKVVNGTLRKRIGEGESLEAALHYVERVLDKRGLTGFDERNTSQRNRAAAVTIGVSIDQLSEADRARFRELAIFPEDALVPMAAIERLWRATAGLDELDTEDLCRRFYDVSLLLRLDLAAHQVHLHDVVRTIVRDQCRGQLPGWNRAMLDTYGGIRWWELPPAETYLWSALPYHLREADLGEQLSALLFDYRWLEAKLRLWSVTALIEDYESLRSIPAAVLVGQAIRLSAHNLAYHAPQLAGQLTGRLSGLCAQQPQIAALCQSVDQWAPRPWIRPRFASLESPGGALLRTYPGHSDKVVALAVNADGRRAVAACWDELTVWDLEADQWLNSFPVHADVSALALTGDGLAVTGHWDGRIKIWDPASGAEIRSIDGHDGCVQALAVTAGGTIVAGYEDRDIRLWNAATGLECGALHGHTAAVIALAVSADGLAAASVAKDNTLRFWDLAGRRQRKAVAGLRDMTAMAISRDGSGAVAASWQGSMVHCVIDRDEPVSRFGGALGKINALAITPDGRRALSAGDDKTIRVWDLTTGAELHVLRGHSERVTAVVPLGDGSRAVSASWDRTLKHWDATAGASAASAARGHAEQVTAVALAADGNRALSAAEDGSYLAWDVAGGTERPLNGDGAATHLAVTGNGEFGLAISELDHLTAWNLATGEPLSRSHLAGDLNRIIASRTSFQVIELARSRPARLLDLIADREIRRYESGFTPEIVTTDGRCAISMRPVSVVRRYGTDSGQLTDSYTIDGYRVHDVAVAGANVVAIASAASETVILNPQTGETAATYPFHDDRLQEAGLSVLGTRAVRLLWAGKESRLEIMDLARNSVTRSIEGATCAAISEDGRRILQGNAWGSLYFWDGERHFPRRAGEHRERITAVAISADGTRAVSGSQDGTVKLWDLDSLTELERLSEFSAIVALAITPDGKRIAALDRSLTIWEAGDPEGFHRSFPDHVDELAVALNADGTEAVTGAALGHTPAVWDIETGKRLYFLPYEFPWQTSVTVTSDKRLAFCFSRGWPVEVWDLTQGKALRHFGWEVSAAAVSGDGRRVAMVTRDGTLSIWNPATGVRQDVFTADAPLLKCAIADDARTIVAGDNMGRVHFFTVVE